MPFLNDKNSIIRNLRPYTWSVCKQFAKSICLFYRKGIPIYMIEKSFLSQETELISPKKVYSALTPLSLLIVWSFSSLSLQLTKPMRPIAAATAIMLCIVFFISCCFYVLQSVFILFDRYMKCVARAKTNSVSDKQLSIGRNSSYEPIIRISVGTICYAYIHYHPITLWQIINSKVNIP